MSRRIRPALRVETPATQAAPARRTARLAVEQLEDRLAPSATPIHDLYVCAHEDDTLLFMNPDMQASIRAGNPVETVFLTAGDAGLGVDYQLEREAGARAAYALLAGV